jgi:hypothetical protein
MVADGIRMIVKDELVKGSSVSNVDRMKIRAERNVLRATAAEVVDYQHLVTRIDGSFRDVAPDEARPAGD